MPPENPNINPDCSPASPDAPAPSESPDSKTPTPDCPESPADPAAPTTHRKAGIKRRKADIKRPFRIPWRLNPLYDFSKRNQS